MFQGSQPQHRRVQQKHFSVCLEQRECFSSCDNRVQPSVTRVLLDQPPDSIQNIPVQAQTPRLRVLQETSDLFSTQKEAYWGQKTRTSLDPPPDSVQKTQFKHELDDMRALQETPDFFSTQMPHKTPLVQQCCRRKHDRVAAGSTRTHRCPVPPISAANLEKQFKLCLRGDVLPRWTRCGNRLLQFSDHKTSRVCSHRGRNGFSLHTYNEGSSSITQLLSRPKVLKVWFSPSKNGSCSITQLFSRSKVLISV